MSNSVMSGDDYPEHLNPFDDNYNGVAVVAPSNSRQQKYNTWNSSRPYLLSPVKKQKPTFLEKPWAALNISPKGKIVRRLSILKTTVERFASKKKKRLEHTTSYKEQSIPPRSNSMHEDFNFKIISPKVKEKLRQQAFSRSISNQSQDETEPSEYENSTLQPNGRLQLSLKLDAEETINNGEDSPSNLETKKEYIQLGARPKIRKKKPPPPPPQETSKQINLVVESCQVSPAEDSHSANSSITQDLEKDVSTDEDNSLTELEQSIKQEDKNG